MKKVVVGLSGGVDSSVAAYLLKEQGYEVIGMFMINWHDNTGVLEGDCPREDDKIFAEMVAKKLDIPFHVVDLSDQYRKRIVDYMFHEYEKGRTPNPDVLCNREVKFDLFMQEAMNVGADYIATGHYCIKEVVNVGNKKINRLIAGVDPDKEQSYFLCQLTQAQLEKSLFPIGHLYKKQVRDIASENNLPTATRKDSQGICFIGKVSLPVFLQQKLAAKKGSIIEIPDDSDIYEIKGESIEEITAPFNYHPDKGVKIGIHNGAHFYTIGQRKGLNMGGKKEPTFVIETDTENNIIYVGVGRRHPGLYRRGLFIKSSEIHWIREDMQLKTGDSGNYDIRIRYRQDYQSGTLHMRDDGLFIIFENDQRGIAPGQFAAWYKENELLGSGVIS